MAKKGLHIATIDTILEDVIPTSGWSLCIGAGTSVPVLPGWFSLVESLIKNNCKTDDIIEIEKYKQMGFSADAMIQAVKNRLHASDDRFIKMLANEVYSPIKNSVDTNEWNAFVKLQTYTLSEITKKDLSFFKKIIDKLFFTTSADLLAQSIIDSILKEKAPKSILTFNGEAIFFALLNYYWLTKQKSTRVKFDRILNGIRPRRIDRIPYIHCHGALPIIGTEIKKGMQANAKLVFSEESYLNLAISPLSWQSINFIENCMNSKMVFVGVSLSDPNMRRWLGWIHQNKLEDLKSNGINTKESSDHFWINKKPATEVEKIWIEESVANLGVRLVWIDEWNQVGEVLNKMLGI